MFTSADSEKYRQNYCEHNNYHGEKCILLLTTVIDYDIA